MAKNVAVAALMVVVAMMLLAVPSMGMRFDHEDVNGVMPGGGSVHFRPDEASKKRLWEKVDAAMLPLKSYQPGSILVPDAQLATTVGDTIVSEATAHIGSTLFNKIGSLVSNVVNTYGKSVVIPGQSTSHFSFSDIHFSQFDVGSVDFVFTAPNKIRFSIKNLNIVVPDTLFHVYAKVVFVKVSCHGYVKASITGTSLEVDLTLATNTATKKLVVTGATSTVSFGHLSISHKMSNVLCKVGQSIIQLVIGNIDKLITKTIKESVPAAVGPIIQQLLNNQFAKLPLHIVSQPKITSAGIDITAVLIQYPKSSALLLESGVDSIETSKAAAARSNLFRIAKPAKGTLMQMLSPLDTTVMLPPTIVAAGDTNRDINLLVSESNVNKALQIYSLEGKLGLHTVSKSKTTSIFKDMIPAAYARCPNCNLAFDATTPESPPTVDFKNTNITVAGRNVHIDISAMNGTQKLPLFGLSLNGTVQVVNVHTTGTSGSTLMFNLGVPVFEIKLRTSPVGPIPLVPAVDSLLRGLIKDVIVPAFNALFPGFEFPPTLIQQVLAQVTEHQVNVGMNIAL
jgi:hypothetical protein